MPLLCLGGLCNKALHNPPKQARCGNGRMTAMSSSELEPAGKSVAVNSGGISGEYIAFLHDVKEQIAAIRVRAASLLNTQMLVLYHRIGEMIAERAQGFESVSKMVSQLS